VRIKKSKKEPKATLITLENEHEVNSFAAILEHFLIINGNGILSPFVTSLRNKLTDCNNK
jgi:hypothetical protein